MNAPCCLSALVTWNSQFHFLDFEWPLNVIIIGFTVWLNLGMTGTMWLKHRNAPLLKKLLWTPAILFFPVGWLLYLGLFRVPSVTDTPCPPNGAAMTGGGF